MFGVVFPDHTFPLDATAFAQVAPNSWLLDLSTLALAAAPRSAVVFLLPAALPPGKAVAVYFQAAANRPFAFLGALGPTRPSASFPLPEAGDEPEPAVGPAKLGVAVEDAAALPPPPDEQRARSASARTCSTSCSRSAAPTAASWWCPRTSWTGGSANSRSGPRRIPLTSKASTFESEDTMWEEFVE